MTPPPNTAALVLIGNELLSGKIRDENGAFLARELWALGVELRRIEVVPDEIDLIVDALQRARQQARHLFTSGGVGPTHDDVTIPAVAQALGVRVVHEPVLEQGLRAHYGEQLNEAHLRLAEVPEGAQLLWGEGEHRLRYPVVLAGDVLILPGVPSFFANRFEAVKGRYRAAPIVLSNVYLSVGEDRIAATLSEATARFPGIAIGSYPRFDDADHRVRVTIESRDGTLVVACTRFVLERLRADLTPDPVVRLEEP